MRTRDPSTSGTVFRSTRSKTIHASRAKETNNPMQEIDEEKTEWEITFVAPLICSPLESEQCSLDHICAPSKRDFAIGRGSRLR